MKEIKDYILLDYKFLGGTKNIKIVLTYYNNIPKVDIREYYFDKNENAFKPTKKGIQLDAKKAEAVRFALEHNSSIIDKHLINEDLEKWVSQIKCIESSDDYFSDFEFYKTKTFGSKEEIIFNLSHPVGEKLSELKNIINDNEPAQELMFILLSLLISYEHTLSQFDVDSKINAGDFIQDQKQMWSSLKKIDENSAN